MKTSKSNLKTAKRIANVLFREGGTRKVANRLALVIKEGNSEHMSGWCKGAVIDRIQEELDKHPQTK